jgi:hypothetical protein
MVGVHPISFIGVEGGFQGVHIVVPSIDKPKDDIVCNSLIPCVVNSIVMDDKIIYVDWCLIRKTYDVPMCLEVDNITGTNRIAPNVKLYIIICPTPVALTGNKSVSEII